MIKIAKEKIDQPTKGESWHNNIYWAYPKRNEGD